MLSGYERTRAPTGINEGGGAFQTKDITPRGRAAARQRHTGCECHRSSLEPLVDLGLEAWGGLSPSELNAPGGASLASPCQCLQATPNYFFLKKPVFEGRRVRGFGFFRSI
jgi:hypothetical protein